MWIEKLPLASFCSHFNLCPYKNYDLQSFLYQSFIQRFWFGVEGGVAVSRTVSLPSLTLTLILWFWVMLGYYIVNLVDTLRAILGEILITYIVAPTNVHAPPPSLSFPHFLFSFFFSLSLGEKGGGVGAFPRWNPVDIYIIIYFGGGRGTTTCKCFFHM